MDDWWGGTGPSTPSSRVPQDRGRTSTCTEWPEVVAVLVSLAAVLWATMLTCNSGFEAPTTHRAHICTGQCELHTNFLFLSAVFLRLFVYASGIVMVEKGGTMGGSQWFVVVVVAPAPGNDATLDEGGWQCAGFLFTWCGVGISYCFSHRGASCPHRHLDYNSLISSCLFILTTQHRKLNYTDQVYKQIYFWNIICKYIWTKVFGRHELVGQSSAIKWKTTCMAGYWW